MKSNKSLELSPFERELSINMDNDGVSIYLYDYTNDKGVTVELDLVEAHILFSAALKEISSTLHLT